MRKRLIAFCSVCLSIFAQTLVRFRRQAKYCCFTDSQYAERVTRKGYATYFHRRRARREKTDDRTSYGKDCSWLSLQPGHELLRLGNVWRIESKMCKEGGEKREEEKKIVSLEDRWQVSHRGKRYARRHRGGSSEPSGSRLSFSDAKGILCLKLHPPILSKSEEMRQNVIPCPKSESYENCFSSHLILSPLSFWLTMKRKAHPDVMRWSPDRSCGLWSIVRG